MRKYLEIIALRCDLVIDAAVIKGSSQPSNSIIAYHLSLNCACCFSALCCTLFYQQFLVFMSGSYLSGFFELRGGEKLVTGMVDASQQDPPPSYHMYWTKVPLIGDDPMPCQLRVERQFLSPLMPDWSIVYAHGRFALPMFGNGVALFECLEMEVIQVEIGSPSYHLVKGIADPMATFLGKVFASTVKNDRADRVFEVSVDMQFGGRNEWFTVW